MSGLLHPMQGITKKVDAQCVVEGLLMQRITFMILTLN